MRKWAVVLVCVLLLGIIAGCADPEEGLEKVDMNTNLVRWLIGMQVLPLRSYIRRAGKKQ